MPNLILTRRRNQSIQIGDNITVTVVSVAGGDVKLAIEAPLSVKVARTELLPPKDTP